MALSHTDTEEGLVPGTVSIFCAVLLAIEIAELSVRIPLALGGTTQYWLMRCTPWVLGVLVGTAVWWSRHLGKIGLVVGLAGAGLGFVVVTNYRGTYIWPGIFDLLNMPGGELKIAYWLGTITGCAFQVLKSTTKIRPDRTTDFGLTIGLFLCALIEWVCISILATESEFAPLRHLALLVLAGIFGIFLGVSEVSSK